MSPLFYVALSKDPSLSSKKAPALSSNSRGVVCLALLPFALLFLALGAPSVVKDGVVF